MGAGAAAGVASWQSAPVLVSAGCARCGGVVSWLCRLPTFLLQPVACQQVAGFCLAIWGLCWCIFPLGATAWWFKRFSTSTCLHGVLDVEIWVEVQQEEAQQHSQLDGHGKTNALAYMPSRTLFG